MRKYIMKYANDNFFIKAMVNDNKWNLLIDFFYSYKYRIKNIDKYKANFKGCKVTTNTQ